VSVLDPDLEYELVDTSPSTITSKLEDTDPGLRTPNLSQEDGNHVLSMISSSEEIPEQMISSEKCFSSLRTPTIYSSRIFANRESRSKLYTYARQIIWRGSDVCVAFCVAS
jgi:hypothetical protein